MAPDEFQLVRDFLRGHEPSIQRVDEWILAAIRQYEHALVTAREDLKQEIRIRVIRNLQRGSYKGHSTLRTYVHRIAKNACVDAIREETRRRRTVTGEASFLQGTSNEANPDMAWMAQDFLAKVLEGCSSEDRALLDMVFVEHLSHAEIAGRLSIPTATVKTRVFRCKNRLVARQRELMRMKSKEWTS